MPATDTEQPPAVDRPKHKLSELTTGEMRDYRRQLESAIAFFDSKSPVPAARGELQARLDAVRAEEDERRRIAQANRS